MWGSAKPSPTAAKAVGAGDAPGAPEADIPQIYLYAPEYSEEVAQERRDKFLTK